MSVTLPKAGSFGGRHGCRRSGCRALRLEALETRCLLSVSVPGVAYTNLHIGNDIVPYNSSPPSGSLTPAQVRQAYGITGVTGDGTGTTIAIIDAYNAPTIATDVAAFSSYYGLPACNLTVVNQTGGTSLPRNSPSNDNWEPETSLDVEWAHTIAPGAKILLVEANSDSTTNLYAAVNYARGANGSDANNTGVVVVSMSWGSGDSSGESSYDSYFTTPSGHIGVTFVTASGDKGAPPGYPGVSPNVVSVGGTSLSTDSNGNRTSETGAYFSGGGISSYESQPSYQSSYATSHNNSILNSTGDRCNPDVSLVASNLPFYDSHDYSGGWAPGGSYGTSFACPQWAGLIALADQGRILASLGSLTSTAALADLYSIPDSCYYDITSGTSTGSPNYSCGTGYDLVTGLGVPVANLLVPALVGTTSPAPGTPDLVAAYDTGASSTDNITNLNNGNSGTELQFTVPNTISGATVTLYCDASVIGSAVAAGTSTTVTTSGSLTIGDGTHGITARQTVPGSVQSAASAALTVTFDTTPPTISSLTPSVTTIAYANQGTAAFSLTTVFSEAMNPAVLPTLTVGDTTGTLTFNPGASGWSNNNTTYVAAYNVTDQSTTQQNVAVSVAGGQDVAGNAENPADFTNVFNIDMVTPTVTINQAAGQADPTTGSPVNFTVVFSIPMVNFGAGDVTLSGAAGANTEVVTDSGDHMTYNVAVSGMTGDGTVIATVDANVARDADGNFNLASTSTDNTVIFDTAFPQVVGVYVSGSLWNPSYLATLATAGVGDATLGYKLPDGAGQLANANVVNWVDADTVTIVFSKPVSGVTASSLALTDSGNNGGVSSGITVVGENSPNATTATFTLSSALTSNKYYLSLTAAGITDAVGSTLDGEWTTGVSTFAAGSGDDTPGGNFNFEFYVLAGDVNGDGKVLVGDVLVLRANSSPTVDQTNWHFDINGDGKVSAGDQIACRSVTGVILANYPEPLAPPTGAVVLAALDPSPADAAAASPPADPVPAADAGVALGGDAVAAPAAVASDSPAVPATPDTSPAAAPDTGVASVVVSVPAVAAPVVSAADEAPSSPISTAVIPASPVSEPAVNEAPSAPILTPATTATVAAGPAADVAPSASPWMDASNVIVSAVPVLPAEATLPVADAGEVPAARVVVSIQSDGWEAEQALRREAALAEAAGAAMLADSSQTAARDAWFAEFGSRSSPLVGGAVGLDAMPSPVGRSPMMAAEEATGDTGAAFYRQLAAKHTLRLVSSPTDDDTDLATLASAGVRPSISASPIRGIEPVSLSGSHASPAGESRDV